MDKDTSEIAKLTERISKDPKSKLFVPLAEEYKKTGDLEMSIHVLTEGLKNNPGYVTARSFLGRLLIEKGDLAGAQKEFEEVVKAIPDNLMAQRKLGDLYALQDRPAEALPHYKIALSLNPGDQETVSLVSDVEAGRDVKPRLSKPKPQVSEEKAKMPEPAQAAPTQPAPKPTPAAAKQGTKPVKAADIAETAEEVLVVEPLEPAAPAALEQELAFLAEPAQEEPAAAEEGDVFALNEPFASEQVGGEVLEAEESLFGGAESEKATAEGAEKQADDFTTDTLAELYISQGFFEKAVDIYERMLVDNPNSEGLKNKLANVRAMAAEAAPAEGTKIEAKPLVAPARPAGTETHPAGALAGLDEFLEPAQKSELPQPDEEWSLPATPAPGLHKEHEVPAAQPPKPARHFDVGFEPVEYVPPDAIPRKSVGEAPGKRGEQAAVSPRKAAAAGRKETIDRLENWLHNIKKEK